MFYKLNHIYKCYWNAKAYPDEYYLNLITKVDKHAVFATCIFKSKYGLSSDPTGLSLKPLPGSVVIDLGHRDDLPELFI